MEFEDGPENPAPELAALSALGPKLEDALVPLMTGLVAACGWM